MFVRSWWSSRFVLLQQALYFIAVYNSLLFDGCGPFCSDITQVSSLFNISVAKKMRNKAYMMLLDFRWCTYVNQRSIIVSNLAITMYVVRREI